MNKFRVLMVMIVLSAGSAAFAGNWTGFDEGFRDAAKRNVPVIVDFSAEWCGWCKKMDSDVFSRPEVSSRLAKEAATVRIDVDSKTPLTYRGKTTTAGQLAGLVGVQGLPTLVVFDSRGNKLAELVGYVDAKYFLRFLDYIKTKKYQSMGFEAYLRSGEK